MEAVNRIKMVLFEKRRTSKWLSEQLGVNPSIKQRGVQTPLNPMSHVC